MVTQTAWHLLAEKAKIKIEKDQHFISVSFGKQMMIKKINVPVTGLFYGAWIVWFRGVDYWQNNIHLFISIC